MNEHDPVDIEERVAQWEEHDDYKGHDPKSEAYTADQVAADQERYSVPVVEEDVKVGKRKVERGGQAHSQLRLRNTGRRAGNLTRRRSSRGAP